MYDKASPEVFHDFDIYDLEAHAGDFFDAWLCLQGRDIVWTPRNGGHWIATSGATIEALFGEPALSNAILSVPREYTEHMGFLPLQADAPVHAGYRKPVMQALLPKYIMALEPIIRESARALIEDIRIKGACDFVTDFAEVLPIDTFLTLAGFPTEDRPMLRELGEQLNRPDGTVTPEQLMAMADDYLRPHVLARLEAPGRDLLSIILAAGVAGRPWQPDEAMRLARNLLFGGLDTVAALLGFVFNHLVDSREQREALASDPKLAPKAALELTRRFASALTTRVATADIVAADVQIMAGDLVLLPPLLYNLDPRCFDRPLEVDFNRDATRHLGMGSGAHRCVGANLVQLELLIVLEEWFRVLPNFTRTVGQPTRMRGGGVGSMATLPLTMSNRA
ncbi:cytochrome P450 [Sphingomonas sp.]|uniref:cytochrome P450 n=1 Tax=Sphingomonas sp. TaxID=28214 RepID=UPI003AFFEB30